MSDGETPAVSLSAIVVEAHTTTHLPPARAVITTPALVALMEQCIAQGEAPAGSSVGRWVSVAADVQHRAGARRGDTISVRAERTEGATSAHTRWQATATAADGRLIAEGTIERVWNVACPA